MPAYGLTAKGITSSTGSAPFGGLPVSPSAKAGAEGKMEDYREVICSECEWTGDGKGLTECPVCGGDLTALLVDDHSRVLKDERYDPQVLDQADDF